VRRVRVEVPATTANLGPGFDSLGLALDVWNRFDVAVSDDEEERGVYVSCEGEGEGELPQGAENLVYRAMERGFEGEEIPAGVRIHIQNRVPLSSGLGSSATAVVAGLLAANALRRRPLDDERLLEIAAEMEGHPDNVAPALRGGLVVSALKEGGGVVAISVRPPEALKVCVAVPDLHLSTRISRGKLPEQVRRGEAVFNLARAALWVAAVTTGELEALRTATEDALHQPYRRTLIPGLEEVFSAALEEGAWGVALSGSGPSVAAFCSAERCGAVGEGMRSAFQRAGLAARVIATQPAPHGARVIWDASGEAAPMSGGHRARMER